MRLQQDNASATQTGLRRRKRRRQQGCHVCRLAFASVVTVLLFFSRLKQS